MLEALGPVGIERCYTYQCTLHIDKNGKSEEEVESIIIKQIICHCEEKLLKLKNLLFTNAAAYYARPLHEYIEEYVAKNQQKYCMKSI